MSEKMMYSSILQDFARPLLYASDTNDEFINKMKIAELIWNYCIAKEFDLPVFSILDEAITAENINHPEMKLIFDLFVETKKLDYGQYKNFIFRTELRIGKQGNKTVYVESIHPSHYKEILNGTTRH